VRTYSRPILKPSSRKRGFPTEKRDLVFSHQKVTHFGVNGMEKCNFGCEWVHRWCEHVRGADNLVEVCTYGEIKASAFGGLLRWGPQRSGQQCDHETTPLERRCATANAAEEAGLQAERFRVGEGRAVGGGGPAGRGGQMGASQGEGA
jgi:hypothetical protein